MSDERTPEDVDLEVFETYTKIKDANPVHASRYLLENKAAIVRHATKVDLANAPPAAPPTPDDLLVNAEREKMAKAADEVRIRDRAEWEVLKKTNPIAAARWAWQRGIYK